MLDAKSQKPFEKKRFRLFAYSAFTVLSSCFFSLIIACLLELAGICFAVSLDGRGVMERYPRFIPFCAVVGVLALGALAVVTAFNVKKAKSLGYTKSIWLIQYAFAFLGSVPLVFLWELLFDFLQKTF